MSAPALLLFIATLQAQNATRPGRFHVEHPTLLNVGFEWAIEGDVNRNATVEVRFRKAGTTAWHSALPYCSKTRAGTDSCIQGKSFLFTK